MIGGDNRQVFGKGLRWEDDGADVSFWEAWRVDRCIKVVEFSAVCDESAG